MVQKNLTNIPPELPTSQLIYGSSDEGLVNKYPGFLVRQYVMQGIRCAAVRALQAAKCPSYFITSPKSFPVENSLAKNLPVVVFTLQKNAQTSTSRKQESGTYLQNNTPAYLR